MFVPLVTDQPASILVVEDSPINQRQLQQLLSKQGYSVTVASHGKEALALLERLQPDLLLLDVVMPEMDGLSLCRLLKDDPATREIPVIFISSLDHTADKLSGFAAGGVDYITKPFHPAEVMARISTHLHLRMLQRQLAENNRQLAEEKRKSEALLLNVLPAQVARELMERGSCTPQYFPEVSVGFVDIVHFTDIAALLPPELLISELNILFTAFDRIVEAHHCERMKTIGDAYLFVTGIPEPRADHSRLAALVALEMIDYLKGRNQSATQQWQVRIGLHSGPVVGGIVGTKKYLYDIFGDTVNIAARLQGMSRPMRINVSADFCRGLEEAFVFSCSQDVEMKGKGLQATRFLDGRRE
jgi:CheY-like chemotaxis protein